MSAVVADLLATPVSANASYYPTARTRRYILAAILANLLVWTVAVVYLAIVPPRYTSEWSLIIPASDTDARVNLTDVGQAYGTARSSYDSRSLDPRVNYKSIADSSPVLAAAAALSGTDPREFPRPRIKLLDQSSIISLEITADDPDLARARAVALNKAFAQRLADLRTNETEERDAGVKNAIAEARDNLHAAQQELLQFRTENAVFSSAQLDEMANTAVSLEARRKTLAEQLAGRSSWLRSARQHLGVDSHQAAHSLIVQSDSLFLAHYAQYVEATALLSDYAYKFGANHPRVKAQQKRATAMFNKLAARALELHGPGLSETKLRKLIILMDEKSREPLFGRFVEAAVEYDSLNGEISVVESQISELNSALEQLARKHATLEDLERRVQFAEAVFNSALGKIDVGRSNVYSSYPLVQNLVAPTLPSAPSSPLLVLVILGALAASIFFSIGLSLAWLRNKHVSAS